MDNERTKVKRGSSEPAGAPAQSHNRWVITLAVTVGTLMGAIDTSIVNVALPYMQSNLGVAIDQITWVSTGYLISLVIIMPLTAWLGSMFGRKRVYMSCLLLFIVASFFCGTAHSLEELVFFRILQGVGAGALQPTEQAILRETFPVEEQGLAMALYGLAVMIGPAVGPTLGGWITDNYNWRWIFFINIPIGICGLTMVWRVIQDPPFLKGRRPMKIDYVGISLLAVGLATLQTVLEQGERNDWFSSSFIIAMSMVSLVSLVGFVWWELRVKDPVVDLRLLKNIPFTSATIIGGVLGVSLFSSMFLLPQFAETLLGYNPMQAGLALMPRSLAMIVMMPISGSLYNRLGARVMIGVGLLISGVSGWAMSWFTSQTGTTDLMLPQVGQGIGFALVFVSLSTVAFAAVPRDKLTNAAGLYNLVRQLGGSFGVAVIATLLTNRITLAHAALAQHVSVYNPVYQQWMAPLLAQFKMMGMDAATAQIKALGILSGLLERESSVIGFDYVFELAAILLFVCVPMVLMLKNVVRSGKGGPPQVAME